MSGSTFDLLKGWGGHRILVDTNVLVLWMVGAADKTLIQTFKRTRQFDAADFELLQLLLNRFSSVVTTPNVLTEVSNLCGQLGEPQREALFTILAEKVKVLDEHYVPSHEAVESEMFLGLGLTDAGIHLLAGSDLVILTDDWRAAGRLQARGANVINFNHVRNYY